MSLSPESITRPVLRGDGAQGASTADFGVDLRSAVPVNGQLVRAAREAARTAGYAEGWAQGQRAARQAWQLAAEQRDAVERIEAQQRAEATRRVLAAVAAAAAGLDARQAPALRDVQEVILAAATQIAEAIVGYEITHGEQQGLAAVRRALALLPDGGPVTVRLHPEQYREVTAAAGDDCVVDGRRVTVRPDAELSPGDAVADYGSTTVDATVAAAVGRVRAELAR